MHTKYFYTRGFFLLLSFLITGGVSYAQNGPQPRVSSSAIVVADLNIINVATSTDGKNFRATATIKNSMGTQSGVYAGIEVVGKSSGKVLDIYHGDMKPLTLPKNVTTSSAITYPISPYIPEEANIILTITNDKGLLLSASLLGTLPAKKNATDASCSLNGEKGILTCTSSVPTVLSLSVIEGSLLSKDITRRVTDAKKTHVVDLKEESKSVQGNIYYAVGALIDPTSSSTVYKYISNPLSKEGNANVTIVNFTPETLKKENKNIVQGTLFVAGLSRSSSSTDVVAVVEAKDAEGKVCGKEGFGVIAPAVTVMLPIGTCMNGVVTVSIMMKDKITDTHDYPYTTAYVEPAKEKSMFWDKRMVLIYGISVLIFVVIGVIYLFVGRSHARRLVQGN